MKASLAPAMLLLGSIVSVSAQYVGWLIPPGGHGERSPLSSEPKTIARGKALYSANCARCHGPEGKGDGPDSDYASDLTDDLRVSQGLEIGQVNQHLTSQTLAVRGMTI